MLNLRARILMVLAGTALAFLVAVYAIGRATLLPSFLELEAAHAVANLERGTAALQNEISFVGDFAGDWSGWDDTYAFVTDRNPDYAKSNLDNNAFRPDSFDFLSFINLKGEEVWRGCEVDGERQVISQLPTGKWPLQHKLLQVHGADECTSGIVMTNCGALLVASRPIVDSARKAVANGWLVMGRFLTPARQQKLAQQTGLKLTIASVATGLDAQEVAVIERLADGREHDLFAIDDQCLVTSTCVAGLQPGRDDLLLRVYQERRILAQGRTTLGFALGAMVVAVLLLFAVLMFVLQRSVVAPVRQLKDHAVQIRASDDLTRRCAMARTDEIGTLATEFDGMVARLASSQAKMLVHAREGGMAEVASEVLHDVGNALQSVTTSAGLLRLQLGSQSVDDLERLSALLAQHAGDMEQWLHTDPKGQRVPAFLGMLAGSLMAERGAMTQELAQLADGIQHIEHLVRQQTQHTHRGGVVESVQVADLVDEAVRLSAVQVDGVTVVQDVAAGVLRTDKHRLLAVLINLLNNAGHSARQVAVDRRTIRITASVADGRFNLCVADQGVGIKKENLTRVFETGYSTKASSAGRGLHSSANGVRQLGGQLRVTSDGENCGACFHLSLPVTSDMVVKS
jgi:two-component system, NtrC family, sensor kinase